MAGEVALEASACFSFAFAFSDSSSDVVLGGLMAAGPGHDHGMEHTIQSAVPAAVESVTHDLT